MAKVRKAIDDKGVIKKLGFSWIEIVRSCPMVDPRVFREREREREKGGGGRVIALYLTCSCVHVDN